MCYMTETIMLQMLVDMLDNISHYASEPSIWLRLDVVLFKLTISEGVES